MEYITLSPDDRLALTRDRLRAIESDHYRLSIALDLDSPVTARQLKELEVAQARLLETIKELETKGDTSA